MKTLESDVTNVENELPITILDPALELVLRRVRIRAKRRVAWLRMLWSEEGGSGGKLAVTHAEIDTHLDGRDSPAAEALWYESDETIQQWSRELEDVEAGIAADRESRLLQLKHIFGLNDEEFDLFQLCLAVLIDPTLSRVYAYLHDHAGRGYATQQLAARLFANGHSSCWNPESPLSRWELLKEKEVGPGEPNQLSCDSLIHDWILGNSHLDKELVNIGRFYTPVEPLKDWSMEETVTLIQRLMNQNKDTRLRLHIEGASGCGRRSFAASISSGLGMSLLAIDSDMIEEKEWQRVFVRAQRQAYLDQHIPAWYGENSINRAWPNSVTPFPVQFVIVDDGQAPPTAQGLVDQRITIPMPSVEERLEMWRRFIPISAKWPEESFKRLVTQHRVGAGDIVSIANRDVQTVEEAFTLVRDSARHKMGKLAQILECPFNWDDLVVSGRVRDALEDLAFEARERAPFWERAEARRMFPQGRALLSLFNGPPGTGKTMAAQVIASSLGLDLYRIDLSAVVSKYVGETSQNLEKILSRAARMDIVLLFDEADALFGKRTEVKDAHDRFANTDTGYLLQAIENYRGVAILATNKKGNIDPAFIRRIRYVLEFPKPDAAQREVIWRKVIGELAGKDILKKLSTDLKSLAVQLELTGAQIKYAILSAIFAAKRDKKTLSLKHLLRGVDREFMKEGRALSGRERERIIKK